ncbi:putative E3 ubiquitin-protein ligase ariadne-2 isoform X3 [Babylonia areolata]|uniref:putative E3 ubiquitin-protein ligase ariadne-2 isoform X3 n=1 Tax=Babylonia areolata TaxID=304850 RepID=UPI003FD37EAA
MSEADMKRQLSDPVSDDSESEDMEEDEEFANYYNDNTDDLDIDKPKRSDDPEYFEYTILQTEDAERLLNEEVEVLCSALKVSPSLAKMLLHVGGWQADYIIERYQQDQEKLLVESNISCAKDKKEQDFLIDSSPVCPVCVENYPRDKFMGLSCGHHFCPSCWEMHFRFQIEEGVTMGIECMGQKCKVLVPEDFLYKVLTDSKLRDRFSKLCFMDLIKGHPKLRFCPGPNCSVIIHAKEPRAKKVECSVCKSVYCFRCGIEYHAPTDCDVIKKWLTKCADDSETANYISAHTKDCPKCHVCIEKNGGCNHMQCSKCKFDFCWMCLGDWKSHGSEYYECSRYKENPNIANESVLVQAREALKKYLFYFERWENHAKSLQLEKQTLQKIMDRINVKVMENEGTWIDWQYLQNAAALLKKCRYTLQYTYPYAYYMDKGGRKELFEYQQAQLEAEVENLSWKVERAEITQRGELENQMDIAEKKRQTLLKDFLEV